MATAKTKLKARTKSAVRKVRNTRVVVKPTRRPARKLFQDESLFGALPDMGKWAFPLLKELRDE